MLRVLVRSSKIVIEGLGYSDATCLRDLEKLVNALRNLGLDLRIEDQKLKPEALRQGVVSRV